MPVRAGAFLPPILAPNTYRLVFDAKYECDELEHIVQSKLDLLVFPHPGSVYVGSVLGGTAGSFLRRPSWSESIFSDFLIGSLTGLVLSVVFRRKANVQAIIAVEDFWGGFLIGAIAGYGGQGILNTFLPTSGKGSS